MNNHKSKNIKVSVVIPFYNAEKYLSTAVDSVLGQSLKGIEIILIDDGSRDKSGKIANEYALKHDNIHVLHQPNQGVSMARNAGIKMASGEYIGFVDADDWVERKAYEKMYEAAKAYGCDIVSCDFVAVNPVTDFREVNTFPFGKGKCIYGDGIRKDILPFFIRSDAFASPCNKIYRLDILKSHGIQFPRDIRIGEDYLFNMLAYYRARAVFHVAEVLYNYRIVEGSATNCYDRRLIDNYIKVFNLKNSIIDNWSFISREARRELAARWFINAMVQWVCREINYGGISGIINAHSIINNEFVRQRLQELNKPFCCENRFADYVLQAIYSRSCLKIVLAVYYVKYISPIIAKLRGIGDEKKDFVCDRESRPGRS